MDMEHLVSDKTDREVFETAESATVYPLLADDDGRQIFEEWLTAHDSHGVADTSVSLDAAEFDICLVDGGALQQYGAELRELKSDVAPVLSPVLLVLSEPATEILHTDRGEIADSVFPTTVDEIISRPIRETELEWRIRALLRMRAQSFDLQQRQETLRLFQQAVEHAGHAVYITDTDGTIQYVNPAFERVTGYDQSEAVGETPRLLDSGEMSEAYFDDLWATIRSGEVWDEEILNRRKDGTLYTANQTIAPVTDEGEIRAFVAAQTDITERKERERRLERRTHAIDMAPIGVSITDPGQADNPLIYVNDAFVDLTGYPREEVIGRNCRFLQGEHTDPERVAEIRAAVDAGEPVSVELRNYRKDGTEFWNQLNIAPVTDDSGTVVSFVGFQQDVTGRKQREDQLSVLDRVLRHNLRNDMNVIRGWAEQIQSQTTGESVEQAEQILETRERLLTTVEKERAITAVLTTRPQHHEIDLCLAVEQTVTVVERAHPVDVTVSCPGGVTVSASSDIDRAIQELLTNAVVHSDSKRPAVSVTITPDDNVVHLEIADDGPAIPEMERDVLLGETGRTPTYHGSGLGLWLVNLIVTRSGGRVDHEPRESQGNVVRVTLPR